MSDAAKKIEDPQEVVDMRESLAEFRSATRRAVRAVKDSNRGFPRPALAAVRPSLSSKPGTGHTPTKE